MVNRGRDVSRRRKTRAGKPSGANGKQRKKKTALKSSPPTRVTVAPTPLKPPPPDIVPIQERSPVAQPQPEAKPVVRDLPDGYGDTHIYIMVRDPYWVHAYWEIQPSAQDRALAELGRGLHEVRSVLRVYDLSDHRGRPSFFDITLENLVKSWYIGVQPNRTIVVEIGLLDSEGRFAVLARSNEVTTPRAGMSEIVDEQWMGIDFDKMYALSGGFEVGKSSMELSNLMAERLRGAISSGSGGLVGSMASPVKIKKGRGFWFVLDCELIVYGATEPDATVTMNGRPVKLRPDGTFTLRYALPDGKLILDAHALASDGLEERVIKPVVRRKTESHTFLAEPAREK